MSKIIVKFHQTESAAGLPLPAKATPGSAGLDLAAAEGATLEPGGRRLVPTGLIAIIPAGYEAQIRPRSGLAIKHGVTVLNSPGTIDADYRGEIGVILHNAGRDTYEILRGDRIAQMVVAPVTDVDAQPAAASDIDDADATSMRGSGGFGSTGTGTSSVASDGRDPSTGLNMLFS